VTDAERTEDERRERLINLMARGRWYGLATAKRLAVEWRVPVSEVNRIARAAAAVFSAAA
jgi:hypothetical protein